MLSAIVQMLLQGTPIQPQSKTRFGFHFGMKCRLGCRSQSLLILRLSGVLLAPCISLIFFIDRSTHEGTNLALRILFKSSVTMQSRFITLRHFPKNRFRPRLDNWHAEYCKVARAVQSQYRPSPSQ